MALLLLLLDWSQSHNIALHALTVDHRLRPESAAEAAQVARWCEALGVAHTTLHWHHEQITSGLPEKAREARYALMFEWCRTHHIQHLFTAHHQGDQIETFIFRLLRGSGLEGLSGILPVSSREGIFLHRPLLAFPKSRLVATLQEYGQAWLEDPTNRDTRYTRNALRQLPLDEDIKERISQLTIFFQKYRKHMEYKLLKSIDLCLSKHGEGQKILMHSPFMEQPPELKTRLLHHICKEMTGNHDPIRSEKIARLLANLEAVTEQGEARSGGQVLDFGGKEPQRTKCKKFMLHGTMFHYRPKLGGWEITRAKPLAARSDLAQNKALKQRTGNAQ